MTDRSTRLRLGAFVGLSLAALAALAVLFGGSPRVFSSRARFVITFPEAPGVGVGTPVRKSGVRVGEVTKVDLSDDTGEVQIGVELDGKYKPRLTDEPTISRGLLSGDTTLDFVPKRDRDNVPVEPGDYVPPGSTVPGAPPISPQSLLKGAQDALPDARADIARVVASIQRFEQAVPKVERAVDEIAGLARNGREFVPELRETNLKVQGLIGVAAPDPPNEPVTVRELLRQIIDLLQAVRPAADDLRTLIKNSGPDLQDTLRSVKRTSDSANDLLNPENRKAVAATLKNVQLASDDAVRAVRLGAILVDQAEKTLRELNARLAQIEPAIAGANRVIADAERVSKPVADATPGIVQGVGETVKNASAAAGAGE